MARGSTKAGARAGKRGDVPAKAKKTSGKSAEKAAAEKALPALAKEINTRLEKAEKTQAQTDNNRLTAALRMAEAKEGCKTAGVSFQSWCENNIHQTWETARKLAAIGASDNPEEAIKHSRNAAAARVAAHRERKKVADANAKRATKAKPEEVVLATLETMPEKKAIEAVTSAMGSHGLELVTEQQAREIKSQSKMKPLERAQFAFGMLTATQKTEFMAWAASVTGMEVTFMGQPLSAVKKKGRGRKAA